jgi:hypothetical protein
MQHTMSASQTTLAQPPRFVFNNTPKRNRSVLRFCLLLIVLPAALITSLFVALSAVIKPLKLKTTKVSES